MLFYAAAAIAFIHECYAFSYAFRYVIRCFRLPLLRFDACRRAILLMITPLLLLRFSPRAYRGAYCFFHADTPLRHFLSIRYFRDDTAREQRMSLSPDNEYYHINTRSSPHAIIYSAIDTLILILLF